MFILRFLPVLFLALLLAPAAAQENYAPPLKGPLLVTGTFGELRSDHYHAGLDFRAGTNTPVYAVQDGFVSRIKITGGGYGQAIYVDHPDGFRSVYAHLETLAPELLDTLRARQFQYTSFDQDLKFDSLAFPIERGQKIGGVGNRGHSFGPHLHFEMREIDGDVPVNPMRFGFSIPDKRSPQIRSLRVYELEASGHEISATTYQIGRPGRGQRALPDTIFTSVPDVGIAVKTYDRQDAMPNWNGIYSATLTVDTLRQSGILHDRIPFEDTRYLNAATDYREWTKNTSWFHRLWALPRVQSKGGGALNEGSWIKLQANVPKTVTVDVSDFAGNVSQQKFILKYRPGKEPRVAHPHQYFIPADEESIIERPGFKVFFPDGALYEDLYFQFTELNDNSADRFSPTYHLHDPLTPLQEPLTIGLAPNRIIPDSLTGHVYLGRCDEEGTSAAGVTALDPETGMYVTRVMSFGDYALFLDIIPPTVQINSFPTNLSRYAGFSVIAKDAVGSSRLEFRGTVDGEWVLLEYDAKNDKLTHNFRDSNLARGRHTFALTVTDARGNTTVWKRNFTR
ncbi:M23 family metallopeptidase [Lewinella sp. 4G2]|uniref:M23 family metallopeptidase n=1 Tax=Lewinella sp. 4G2 TaxID=1803372 RepID=UPI0007B48E54|nr:M23 family metallopeptidase [Lewinella sp. 4G2]OAV42662.1 hypothetical protein A3850_015575 [Lewinella sp. 4G2]